MSTCIKCGTELVSGAAYCHVCGKKQIPAAAAKKKTRGNGSGTAFRRGKTWTGMAAGYSYQELAENGKLRLVRKRPTKGGFRTKTEALEWAASQVYQDTKEVPTLLSLWKGWSENDMLKLSKDKIAAYKKARERIEPIIARQIDTLTLDDLQNTVNSAATSHYTARDIKSLLSHLYQRAMASGGSNGSVTVNLSRFIVLPELEEKEPTPFDEAEVNTMWRAWDSGNIFIGYVLLMIYTSMMPAELFACKINMIDYNKHEIYGCGRKTKKRKDVPIVFPEFMSSVLQTLSDYSKSAVGSLYCGNKDNFYSTYHKTMAVLKIRDLPPYSCRHTTATEAVKKGVELPVVQQIMRHAKISSTQRYIHVSTEAAHQGINKLEKAQQNC